MNQQLYVSNFSTTLAASITNVAASATLATGTGALLPTLANGDYVLLTLTQPGGPTSETSWEVIKVTAVSGDTITISQRAVEGTAAAWASGSVCRLGTTGTGMNALSQLLARGTLTTSRNLATTDNNATLAYSGSSPITLTYPTGLGATFSCTVVQLGTGKITVSPAGGVTAGNIGLTNGPGSLTTIAAVAADSYAAQNPVSNGQTLLGVSGIPFIVFATGSWTAAANGVVTVPTQTTAWPYAYVYMPANSITASNPAGWYYGVFSSTTSVTLYNNVYNVATGGTPTIPASPTAFAVAAGTNTTQDTMPIQGPTFTIPGGALGNNGAVQLSSQLQTSSNTNTKTALIGFGSSNTVYGTLNTTNANLGEIDVVLQNLGQQTRQMFRTKTNAVSASAPTILTQDTTANISATVNLNCGTVANDWIILHYARFVYLYGA
jgi:hypothetical protein